MNIFIYGSDAFKSDIHNVLDHSNIKFRLSGDDDIKEISTLIELRTAIENYPKDIFLIDDAKIFRKNALNKKIKFLKSNDTIEEDFLKLHGIGDISINSLEELPAHIIKKLESENEISEDDDYHSSTDHFDIQESIINIVDDAYNNEELDDEEISLDDELSSLLSSNEEDEVDEEDEVEDSQIDEDDEQNLYDDEIDDIIKDEIEDVFEENINLMEEEHNEEVEMILDEKEGENMSDEFSEFDSLNESDILAALDGLDNIDISSVAPVKTQSNNQVTNNLSSDEQGVNLNSSNVNDIAALITQLLNNKTLEITVRVKA